MFPVSSKIPNSFALLTYLANHSFFGTSEYGPICGVSVGSKNISKSIFIASALFMLFEGLNVPSE